MKNSSIFHIGLVHRESAIWATTYSAIFPDITIATPHFQY